MADKTDKRSYWLNAAATALDCAVQLSGDEHGEEISKMEARCDELAKISAERGN